MIIIRSSRRNPSLYDVRNEQPDKIFGRLVGENPREQTSAPAVKRFNSVETELTARNVTSFMASHLR